MLPDIFSYVSRENCVVFSKEIRNITSYDYFHAHKIATSNWKKVHYKLKEGSNITSLRNCVHLRDEILYYVNMAKRTMCSCLPFYFPSFFHSHLLQWCKSTCSMWAHKQRPVSSFHTRLRVFTTLIVYLISLLFLTAAIFASLTCFSFSLRRWFICPWVRSVTAFRAVYSPNQSQRRLRPSAVCQNLPYQRQGVRACMQMRERGKMCWQEVDRVRNLLYYRSIFFNSHFFFTFISHNLV